GGGDDGGSSGGGNTGGGASPGDEGNETNATDERDGPLEASENVTVSVDETTPTTGETVNVTVNVSETTPANGSMAVVWTADNRTIDRTAVEMGSNSSVTLSRSFTSPGEYQVTFANRTSTTVSVDRATLSPAAQSTPQAGTDSPTATPSTATATETARAANATATTGGSGPGFGVVGALVAVLLVFWRRR
ncbi:hypothetical protein NDI56_14555, partial [Haloarcula sp. S1CR25-12]|nr:hypothetical protein [Haloarcula sp. S1CR25-12]